MNKKDELHIKLAMLNLRLLPLSKETIKQIEYSHYGELSDEEKINMDLDMICSKINEGFYSKEIYYYLNMIINGEIKDIRIVKELLVKLEIMMNLPVYMYSAIYNGEISPEYALVLK